MNKFIYIFLFFFVSIEAHSEPSKYRYKIDTSAGKYIFIGVDDGSRASTPALDGITPYRIYDISRLQGHEIPHIGIWTSKSEKKSESTYYIFNFEAKLNKTVVYYERWGVDIASTLQELKEGMRPKFKENSVIDIDHNHWTSIPYVVINGEILSLIVVQSDDLDSLRKIPLSKLSPMFSFDKVTPLPIHL